MTDNEKIFTVAEGKAGGKRKDIMIICPFHDDKNPSLSVDLDQGVYHCFGCGASGCRQQKTESDQKNPFYHYQLGIPAETYCYRDESGTPLYYVCRFEGSDIKGNPIEGKTFRQINAETKKWKMSGVRRVLYHLPDIISSSDRIFITEGEKDADRLRQKFSVTATTCPGGAGKWKKEYNECLSGRELIILPDNDIPGKDHAEAVRRSLSGTVSISVINLPDIPEKGDVSDWMDQGGTGEDLIRLCDSCPDTEFSDNNKGILADPPPVPLDVLPESCQKMVMQASAAFSVPSEIPFTAFLTTVSACIGRTRGIRIKESWSEFANLYIALVGKSGTGKSPCTMVFLNSVFRVEKGLYEKYQLEFSDYLRELEQYDNATKEDRRTGAVSKPEKPPCKQILVDDTTSESLPEVLADNPRGVLWFRDELSGLILDFDKYSGRDGATKTRLMTAYDSGPWKINRKKGRLLIPSACLSIFGTVQPRVLPQLFSDKDEATGFLPRFMFVRSVRKSPSFWSDESFSEDSADVLDNIVGTLLRHDLRAGEPVYIPVSNEARKLYIKWFDAQSSESWLNFDSDAFESILAKLRGQCLRLCLILHCLFSADTSSDETEPISADTMKKAIRLADWFKEHQRQVWQVMGRWGDKVVDPTPLDRRIIEAIVDLRSHIKNGRLEKKLVVDRVNNGVSEDFKISSTVIGRTYKKLGLKAVNGNGVRSVLVPESVFLKFRELTHPGKSVLSVLSVSAPEPVSIKGQRTKYTKYTLSEGSSSEGVLELDGGSLHTEEGSAIVVTDPRELCVLRSPADGRCLSEPERLCAEVGVCPCGYK